MPTAKSKSRRTPRGPSVLDIARQVNALRIESWSPRICETDTPDAVGGGEYGLILDRAEILQDLAFTIPAANLAKHGRAYRWCV
jgi:hypothetical protein